MEEVETHVADVFHECAQGYRLRFYCYIVVIGTAFVVRHGPVAEELSVEAKEFRTLYFGTGGERFLNRLEVLLVQVCDC